MNETGFKSYRKHEKMGKWIYHNNWIKFDLYGVEGHSQVVDWGTERIKVLLVDLDMKGVKGVQQ
jgi:hypothetical protein